MDPEFGLIGSGWQDYHDQQIQPALDQYNQQMSDILTNGAHGAIAQLQMEDDAGGARMDKTAQGATTNGPAPLSVARNGQASALDQSAPDSAALLGRAAYPQTVNLQNATPVTHTGNSSDAENESLLERARNVYSGIAHAVTSPDFTDVLKRQGEYAKKAGDTVGLGGTGLAVAGTVTAQPELLLPGLAGMGVGDTLSALGSAAVVLSDALAQNRAAAIKDSIGGLVGSKLPYTIDPQPAVNGTGKYFGF